MAGRKGKKKKGGHSAQARRRERRFLPVAGPAPVGPVIIGLLGAFATGVGVYAQWVSDPTPAWASLPFFLGLAALAAGMWLTDARVPPLRVGDAGIAIEKGTEVQRLAWCDLERVSFQGRHLVAEGAGVVFRVPRKDHAQGVSWILKEAAERLPDVLDVSRGAVGELPAPRERDGETLIVEGVQIAGKRCAESGESILVEKDARLCGNCGQVYLAGKVPETCKTCGKPLGSRALAA